MFNIPQTCNVQIELSSNQVYEFSALQNAKLGVAEIYFHGIRLDAPHIEDEDPDILTDNELQVSAPLYHRKM